MFDIFSAETYQAIEDWVVLNPNWAGLVVFTIAMSESLAVVGLFIPGLVMMGLIGAWVAAGVLGFESTLIYAILGAVAGDGISYYIGRRFKHHLPYYWPFNKFPQWLERGKKFFIDHGSKSIVIGRFVGPVRPFIPVVAGMMSMRPRTFLFANIVSAIIWAPIYMAPGFGITLWFWGT